MLLPKVPKILVFFNFWWFSGALDGFSEGLRRAAAQKKISPSGAKHSPPTSSSGAPFGQKSSFQHSGPHRVWGPRCALFFCLLRKKCPVFCGYLRVSIGTLHIVRAMKYSRCSRYLSSLQASCLHSLSAVHIM